MKGMEISVMVKTPPRIGRRVMLGLTVVALMAMWNPAPVATAPPREAAADTLAAQGKLLCQRTLRATGWTRVSFQSSYREVDQSPDDSSICGHRSDGYAAVYSTIGAPTVAAGLNGLPAMQTQGQYGGTFIDFKNEASELQSSSGRFGWRIYRWHSNNYLCDRAKYFQVGQNGFWSSSGQNNPGVMWGATGQGVPNSSLANHRQKWWRWEAYINSYQNPSSQTIYLKNISDNTPETSLTVTGSGEAGGLWAPGSTPSFMEVPHEYRDRDGANDTCTVRFMYLIIAKNLGPNERIPPAVELEGGSGGGGTVDRSVPSTPNGLFVR
jgi:hypothetical protein